MAFERDTMEQNVRPIYENEKTIERETRLKTFMEEKWSVRLQKMHMRECLDFCAIRNGEIVAWIECRCRNYDWNKIEELGGYMFHLHKWVDARNKAMHTLLPFILCVECSGDVRYFKLLADEEYRPTVRYFNVNYRNDALDTGPHVYLPVAHFTRLGTI